jgi:hypothetical protein
VEGVVSNLVGEQTESDYYNSKLETWNLAILVGIFGILISIVNMMINEFLSIQLLVIDFDSYLLVLIAYDNFLSISWLIPISVGYVGLFAKKNSRLGIIYPFFTLILTAGVWTVKGILYQLSLDYGVIGIQTELLLGYLATVIGALLLLTLRNKCKNPYLLYSIVILEISMVFLVVIGYLFPVGSTVPVESALQIFISHLPRLSISVLTYLLTIVFFLQERGNSIKEILSS